jgi:hypothetical protein
VLAAFLPRSFLALLTCGSTSFIIGDGGSTGATGGNGGGGAGGKGGGGGVGDDLNKHIKFPRP